MGRETLKRGFMNYAHEEEVTRQVLKQLEEIIDPKTKVENLRLGLQQIVEIARALTINSKILIYGIFLRIHYIGFFYLFT